MWSYITNYMETGTGVEEEGSQYEKKRVIILEDGSRGGEDESSNKAIEPQRNPDTLAALHAKFRADLDAAPLDELKEAARSASHANVAPEAAGGWKITAALAMMRRGDTSHEENDDESQRPTAGWAPFLLPNSAKKANQDAEDVVEFSVGTADDANVPDIYLDEDEEELKRVEATTQNNQVDDEPALLPKPPQSIFTPSQSQGSKHIDTHFETPPPLMVPQEWIGTSTTQSTTPPHSADANTDTWGISLVYEDKLKLSSRWSVARLAEGTPESIVDASGATTLESVGFVDGSWLRLRIKQSAIALELLRATAARIGVEQRDAGALALYELSGARLSRLIAPGESIPRGVKIVLALRLLTKPIHAAGVRGGKSGATRGEAALARLLYAQTFAAVMSGAFAVLPNFITDIPHETRENNDSDRDLAWRDVSLAESDAALPARTRFGALRLLSRARDTMLLLDGGSPSSTSTTSTVGRRLLEEHGPAAFAPHPAPEIDAIMHELDALLSSPMLHDDDDSELEVDLEIEEGQGASLLSTTTDADAPEAAYLELAAKSPAYGCTLFPCTSARRIEEDDNNDDDALISPRTASGSARITRWLAISRRGASILSSDTSVRLHDVPLECARRWCPSKDGLFLEYERPFNRWPIAARRRSSLEEQRQAARKQLEKRNSFSASKHRRTSGDESFVTSLASYFAQGNGANMFDDDDDDQDSELIEEVMPRIETDEYGEVSCRDPKHAPMFRVKFQLSIPSNAGAPGGAAEAVALLDDYCLCDLAESPPDFGWEEASLEAQAAALNDQTPREIAKKGHQSPRVNAKPKTMPGFYDALVSAVVRPPRFNYDPRLLGPSSFRFGGKRFHRRDIVLCNRRGERIHVSWWYQLPNEDDDTKGQENSEEAKEEKKIAAPPLSSAKRRITNNRRDQKGETAAVNEDSKGKKTKPAIVFVHANSASRAQSCHYLSLVLSLGCSLVAFDCAGSGMSDGSLVTLGWREAHDLRVVLDWLRAQSTVSSIALWGQSMGAAAAIYYQGLSALHDSGGLDDDVEDDQLVAGGSTATSPKLAASTQNNSSQRNSTTIFAGGTSPTPASSSKGNRSRTTPTHDDAHLADLRKMKSEHNLDQSFPADSAWPKVDAVVLDSPYSDFQKLATHIANERRAFFGGFSLPTVVLDLLLSSLDASVLNKAGFSPLSKLSPIAHAPRCTSPALFVRARKDPLISQDHVESLAKKYGGPRTLALVEGTHSSPRDVDARKFIGRFLERQLPLPPKSERVNKRAVERHLVCAPWQRSRATSQQLSKPVVRKQKS